MNNVPTDPTFESNWYFVDEDAGTVQVCIHLGGEDLVDTVTLITRDGSARGKFNIETFKFNASINIPDLKYCCSGKRLLKNSADFHSKFWREEVHDS